MLKKKTLSYFSITIGLIKEFYMNMINHDKVGRKRPISVLYLCDNPGGGQHKILAKYDRFFGR